MAGSPHTTVVINLASRRDRRAEMQNELARVNWRADFFPAVRPADRGNFPSIGARGCFLSHLAVLEQADAAGVEELVILEDDLNFARRFEELWTSARAALEGVEWSIFYPGHILEGVPDGLSLLSPTTAVRCTHFMVINRPAIRALIEGLQTIHARPPGHPLGSPMHVDGAYSTIRMQDPSLKTYIYSPVLGYQRPSRTDIHDLKWFDRVRALHPLVGFVRRIKAAR
jgi:glycosyl transferase family 25